MKLEEEIETEIIETEGIETEIIETEIKDLMVAFLELFLGDLRHIK